MRVPTCAYQIRALLMSGPDVVIADEAHQMKNPTTHQCQAMMQVGKEQERML